MSFRASGQKDHLRTPGGGLPEPLRPTRKVQTGGAAVCRPPRSGDQEGNGRPGYPRRSGQPSVPDRAVYGHVRPRPRRRRGAKTLCNFTFTQPVTGGGCPPPSPSGLHVSCWASVPPPCLLLELSRSLTRQVGRKSPRRRARSDISDPEARGDCETCRSH